MPTIQWDYSYRDGDFDANQITEAWSEAWGNSEAQWFGSLYPRLHRLLPAVRILEVGPCFGRWTRFLIPSCSDYLGIDHSDACVAACTARFEEWRHARFVKNDGLSLDEAADGLFDLVFSFDSLVHAEIDVLQSYIPQIMRKLSPNGVAFLHHSNLAGISSSPSGPNHGRGKTVSAQNLAKIISNGGGRVIIQEIIDWVGTSLIDCLTTFGSARDGTDLAVELTNERFMQEAQSIKLFQSPYCRLGVEETSTSAISPSDDDAQLRFGDALQPLENLVLAFVGNYQIADLEPFVASLLSCSPNTHITFFSFNMDIGFYQLAEKLAIEVIDASPHISEECHIHNIRFKLFYDYLVETRSRWRDVLICDVRDVIFQSNPFSLPFPSPVVFATEDQKIVVGSLNYAWLSERYTGTIADRLVGETVVCAGTTIGTYEGMLEYARMIYFEVMSDEYDRRRNLDQGSHNYIAHVIKPDWSFIDEEDQIIATIGCTAPSRVRVVSGLIEVDGKIPSILHQWDRHPELLKYIKQSAKFCLRPNE